MKRSVLLLCALLSTSSITLAGYNDNLVGEVTHVMTYADGLILFRLKNQPTTHPTCKNAYFAISTDTSEVAANRMLSRLLTAHTTKTPTNIGFDNSGGCGNGYIKTYRVG